MGRHFSIAGVGGGYGRWHMALHESLRTAEPFPQQSDIPYHTGKRTRWIAYGAAAAALLVAVWYGAGLFAPKKKGPPPPPVKVATARRGDVTVAQNTIGTVVSPAMVQVTAQVTGKLLAANFQEGDIVHKGQLAVSDRSGALSGDPRPRPRANSPAMPPPWPMTASISSATSTLAQQNAISNQQLVTQPAKLKSDEGVVVTDKAAVDAARINLNFTRIVSPIDGKTGPILIQPGNIIPAVSASVQPLVTITQIQPIKVSFMLPQNGLAQIQNQFNQHRLMAVVPDGGRARRQREGSGRFRQQCGQRRHRHHRTACRFSQHRSAAGAGTDRHGRRHPQPDFRRRCWCRATRSIWGRTAAFVLVVGKDGKAYSKTVKVLERRRRQ